MSIPRKSLRAAAAAAVLTLGLAACSSSGGAQEEAGGGSGGAGGDVVTGGEQYTIAMVTHEAPGDSFWDKIRAGAEDAAAQHGIDLKYSNNDAADQQATLIQNAVASGVDGIATTLVTPAALTPAVQRAIDADIPVVGFNSGIDAYKDMGALMYFGSDETLAGRTVGERITENGGTKALCVIQAQGSVALEARCAGVKETFANTENIQVEGTSLPSVQSTLQAKLAQDPSIDWIVTLGAPIALAALQSRDAAGSEANVATFDLNAQAAQSIADGDLAFSVDQQPYVQGYEAVDSMWRYLSNGNDLGGGNAVLTGPSIVDETNIDRILPFALNNTR